MREQLPRNTPVVRVDMRITGRSDACAVLDSKACDTDPSASTPGSNATICTGNVAAASTQPLATSMSVALMHRLKDNTAVLAGFGSVSASRSAPESFASILNAESFINEYAPERT